MPVRRAFCFWMAGKRQLGILVPIVFAAGRHDHFNCIAARRTQPVGSAPRLDRIRSSAAVGTCLACGATPAQKAPVVDTLTIDGPRLTLRRLASGAYDIDDIIARIAAAPKKPETEDSRPLRFALFNLAITDGSFDFDDQPAARQHALRDFSLALPFLSNLPARRDVTVTPQLAFKLNGSQFASSASTTPFSQSRKTDAQLRIKAMDLAPYLPYIPRSVPVQLQRAVLDADLKLSFVQDGDAKVVLSGQLGLGGVAMADGDGADLLAFDSLKLAFDEIRPLEQRVRIATRCVGPDQSGAAGQDRARCDRASRHQCRCRCFCGFCCCNCKCDCARFGLATVGCRAVGA